ncbi:MAG: hypothetical protein L0210_08220 [Rhodospirillales bacterium]|nr:hypothetical protein [Rhodospirillales bacterium]
MPRQPTFATLAPAVAGDIIVDQMLRPLPWEPPVTGPPRPVAEAAEVSSPLAGPAGAPMPTRRKWKGVVPISLGALAAVGMIVAAVLLRPELEAEPASAMAAAADLDTLEALAEPAVAVTTVHLRVSAGLAPEARQRIEAALANAGYGAVVVHEMPFRISRTRVGYFREAERASAEVLIAALRGTLDGIELRDYRRLIAAPEPGRLDLWIRS